MKIILAQDVAHVGKKNEVKEVSGGFARNFLFPRKLAVLATPQAQAAHASREAHHANRKYAEQEQYQRLAERLEQLQVVLKIKIGSKGKAFGSVNGQKIIDALNVQHHIAIRKEWLRLDEPLKSTGEHKIPVKFPHGVTGEVGIIIQNEEDAHL